jgi:radical SAM protein with 4Fe4S-binding SPASM domain
MEYPKKVQIEVTNHCNLKCKGCLRENMMRKKGYISYDTLLDALFVCTDFEIEEIHLHHWGEPLLHPNILNIVKIVSLTGFRVGFTTNGTLLTHDKLIELKEAGLDKLDISYNKNSKDKRTLRNLYWISKDLGIETCFRSVVFSKEEYDELLDEFYKSGCSVKFQRGMYFDFDRKRDKPCKAIEKIFIINWDGIITPCCAMYDNQYIYGKVEEITVKDLKNQIDILKLRIEEKDLWLENCCNHCFEIDGDFPIDFKL